jgi:acetylornithine aminotransferase
MLGFDAPEQHKTLRKDLLFQHHVFTGESSPNTIRLLPSLALTRDESDFFLEALQSCLNQNTVPSSN